MSPTDSVPSYTNPDRHTLLTAGMSGASTSHEEMPAGAASLKPHSVPTLVGQAVKYPRSVEKAYSVSPRKHRLLDHIVPKLIAVETGVDGLNPRWSSSLTMMLISSSAEGHSLCFIFNLLGTISAFHQSSLSNLGISTRLR